MDSVFYLLFHRRSNTIMVFSYPVINIIHNIFF